MTKKEAIYILRNAAWLGSNEERQKVEEAVEVVAKAIEALNHSEIPNSFGKDTNVHSNDTISRQAAIDALETIGYDFSDSGLSEIELAEVCEAVGDVRQDMIRMIKRLPPAQPEIIRCKDCGHWDTTWQNDFAPNYHYCSLVDGTRRGDFYCADAERRGEQDE